MSRTPNVVYILADDMGYVPPPSLNNVNDAPVHVRWTSAKDMAGCPVVLVRRHPGGQGCRSGGACGGARGSISETRRQPFAQGIHASLDDFLLASAFLSGGEFAGKLVDLVLFVPGIGLLLGEAIRLELLEVAQLFDRLFPGVQLTEPLDVEVPGNPVDLIAGRLNGVLGQPVDSISSTVSVGSSGS